MSQSDTIPVFPLNAHILPGGKMRLRIFEPRYLRMVRENVSAEPAFAMAMQGVKEDGIETRRDAGSNYDGVLPLVTLVRIVDFELLEGGLLGITIEGMHAAKIVRLYVENDGLRRAEVEPVDICQPGSNSQLLELFASAYADLLDEYQELGELYPALPDSDLHWYLLRWLEILPLPSELKQALLVQDNGNKALVTVADILRQGSDPDSRGMRT